MKRVLSQQWIISIDAEMQKGMHLVTANILFIVLIFFLKKCMMFLRNFYKFRTAKIKQYPFWCMSYHSLCSDDFLGSLSGLCFYDQK